MEGFFFLAFSILKTFSSLSALVLFFLHKTNEEIWVFACSMFSYSCTNTCTWAQYSQITFHCVCFCNNNNKASSSTS